MKHIEDDLQAACVRWYSYQYSAKRDLLFAIPNGGKRNVREAARMKLQGVRAGVPDLMLAVPSGRGGSYNGFFIEMKSEKGQLTAHQKDMQKRLSQMGYKTAVIRSVVEFVMLVTEYLGED